MFYPVKDCTLLQSTRLVASLVRCLTWCNYIQHNDNSTLSITMFCHHAECPILFIVVLCVVAPLAKLQKLFAGFKRISFLHYFERCGLKKFYYIVPSLKCSVSETPILVTRQWYIQARVVRHHADPIFRDPTNSRVAKFTMFFIDLPVTLQK